MKLIWLCRLPGDRLPAVGKSTSTVPQVEARQVPRDAGRTSSCHALCMRRGGSYSGSAPVLKGSDARQLRHAGKERRLAISPSEHLGIHSYGRRPRPKNVTRPRIFAARRGASSRKLLGSCSSAERSQSRSCVCRTSGVKLRGPEGAQRLRATSASTSEFGSVQFGMVSRCRIVLINVRRRSNSPSCCSWAWSNIALPSSTLAKGFSAPAAAGHHGVPDPAELGSFASTTRPPFSRTGSARMSLGFGGGSEERVDALG
jgi:hypothetical protein